MTISAKPECRHHYVCVLTANRCVHCGHIEGDVGDSRNETDDPASL